MRSDFSGYKIVVRSGERVLETMVIADNIVDVLMLPHCTLFLFVFCIVHF